MNACPNKILPNGLVFQVKSTSKGLIPLLLMVENPRQAFEVQNVNQSYNDLGIDRVALVYVDHLDNVMNITRIMDVGMLANGDSTTSKRALDILVRDGQLMDFITRSMGLGDSSKDSD